MEINKKLKKYVEENILPEYSKNDFGHNLDHINYVIRRSLDFASTVPNIDYDMVYVIAAYHDIGHHIDANNHEKVSSEIALADKNLLRFFSEDQIRTIAEAIYDHRASLEGEPRSIYGKIVSTADRNVDIDRPLRRTFAYRINHNPELPIAQIIEESRQHLLKKFGKGGYATNKYYFNDPEYEHYLEEIDQLLNNSDEFKKKYIIVNNLDLSTADLKELFKIIQINNPEFSLDQILYAVYTKIITSEPFEVVKRQILQANDIDEYEYYVREVNPDLREYIEKNIFPQYEQNDKAHGMAHIAEVIIRAFVLNDTFKLNLDKNMIFAIAAFHDVGKHINSDYHEMISAAIFAEDPEMPHFFSAQQRSVIKEAIEEHRSSNKEEVRSEYGKLISSADRNTRIAIVFIRSFFVAQNRMPDTPIEKYLDYTINRLRKRYSEDDSENMFYADTTYQVFLTEMRSLLKNEEEFKRLYCEINNIKDRSHKVCEEQGDLAYALKILPNKGDKK